jgi:hypothetical protein
MRGAALNSVLFAWAVAGAPLGYGIFVYASYYYALSQGHLPYGYISFWPWQGVIVTLVTGGTALFLSHRASPFLGRDYPAALFVAYAVLLSLPLAFVHAVAACASGDCL